MSGVVCPSDPAYYTEDCRIFIFIFQSNEERSVDFFKTKTPIIAKAKITFADIYGMLVKTQGHYDKDVLFQKKCQHIACWA